MMQELKKENFDLKLRLYMTQKNGEVSIIVISYLIFHIIIEFKALRRIQSNMYDGAFICDILDVILVLNTSLLRLVSKYQFKVNNPFMSLVYFYTSSKHQQTSGFLFSGCIERDQWYEME